MQSPACSPAWEAIQSRLHVFLKTVQYEIFKLRLAEKEGARVSIGLPTNQAMHIIFLKKKPSMYGLPQRKIVYISVPSMYAFLLLPPAPSPYSFACSTD